MSVLFIFVLNMSITASFVAVAIMLVRLFLKKSPKIFSYALWGVLLFRLICPVSFDSIFGLLPANSDSIPQDIIYHQNPAISSGISMIDSAVNQTIQNSLPPVQPETSINPMGVIIDAGANIWLFGIAVMLCYVICSYIKVKRCLSTATIVEKNIFETDRIKTPFVMGFIKPRIYICAGLSEAELDYIICHEQTHIRRRDYLIKPLSFLVLAVHWFNPLIWISYFLMAKDLELSCDESVIKRSTKDIRAGYSEALLALSIRRSGLFSPLAFGESNVKARVKNALNYKKPAFWVSLVAFAAVVIAVIGLSGNHKAASTQADITDIEEAGEISNEALTETAAASLDDLGSSTESTTVEYPSEAMSEFTEEEVADARRVVEEYYRAWIAKEDDAFWETQVYGKPENATSLATEDIDIALHSVTYDSQSDMRRSYVESGGGRENNTPIENVIVFKTSFEVLNTGEGEYGGSWSKGLYPDWSVILTRSDKNAAWLIASQGY